MGGGALHMGAGGSTLLLPTGAGNGLFCLVKGGSDRNRHLVMKSALERAVVNFLYLKSLACVFFGAFLCIEVT